MLISLVILILGGLLIYLTMLPPEEKDLYTYKTNAATTLDTIENENEQYNAEEVGSAQKIELMLNVSEPNNKSVITSSPVTVKGQTAPNASVFINELELQADNQGLFTAKLNLEEGINYIIIVANDVDGNFAEKELTVDYQGS